MGKLVFGGVLLLVSFFMMVARSGNPAGRSSGLLRAMSLAFAALGGVMVLGALVVVIEPGQVGVKHAFGTVDDRPYLPGIHTGGAVVVHGALLHPRGAVSAVRRSGRVHRGPLQRTDGHDGGCRTSLADQPQDAPRIFVEIGTEEQIHSIVHNAIRQGVRDGMVRFSINDISKRTEIAHHMQALVDSALITQPREGGDPFRIAEVTAFFLRDLQPPAQVVAAINAKIAQEQQIQTERHRVEVARLQSDQQRLLNQTLTAEALTKQYLEVLHDMKGSNNLVVLVPTEGGVPMLDIAKLRQNIQ